MVLDCKSSDDLKNFIVNNKYCVVLVGNRGCSKCASLLPVLEKVYNIYPAIQYIIATESVASIVTKPFVVHAMSVLFFKNSKYVSLVKYSYATHPYIRHIEKMIKD